jgi:hypothetical protein
MIPGIEFGWAEDELHEQCAHQVDADVMLCGRPIGFIPVDGQPDHLPERLHDLCRVLLFPDPTPVEYGTCPACEGRAPVRGGRVQSHTYGPGLPCLGVNMWPKETRP